MINSYFANKDVENTVNVLFANTISVKHAYKEVPGTGNFTSL